MDEMLKIYHKDLSIMRMQRRGLMKQLNKLDTEITNTNEYCRQIEEGMIIYDKCDFKSKSNI